MIKTETREFFLTNIIYFLAWHRLYSSQSLYEEELMVRLVEQTVHRAIINLLIRFLIQHLQQVFRQFCPKFPQYRCEYLTPEQKIRVSKNHTIAILWKNSNVIRTSSISSIVLSTFSKVRPFWTDPDFRASAPILYDSRIWNKKYVKLMSSTC